MRNPNPSLIHGSLYNFNIITIFTIIAISIWLYLPHDLDFVVPLRQIADILLFPLLIPTCSLVYFTLTSSNTKAVGYKAMSVATMISTPYIFISSIYIAYVMYENMDKPTQEMTLREIATRMEIVEHLMSLPMYAYIIFVLSSVLGLVIWLTKEALQQIDLKKNKNN